MTKGFTLVEVLVGLIILAIGLLAIAGMQITSIRGNFFSDNMMQASFIAQDRLEYLKSLQTSGGLLPSALSVGSHDDGSAVIRGITFSRSYNVAQKDGGPMVEVRMTVSWKDTSSHSVSFSTVRSP